VLTAALFSYGLLRYSLLPSPLSPPIGLVSSHRTGSLLSESLLGMNKSLKVSNKCCITGEGNRPSFISVGRWLVLML
jgi:hypothetical protein